MVNALARAGGVKLDKLQEGAAVARCSVAGRRVVLAKPHDLHEQLWLSRSGSLGQLLQGAQRL